MKKALLPLHKPKCVGLYHQQLSYCVTQFVEKDPMTAVTVINALAKYWPWSSSAKQVHFLNELEEILELITDEVFDACASTLMDVIGRCVSSDHFQVRWCHWCMDGLIAVHSTTSMALDGARWRSMALDF